jgi:hypothetical protein
VLTTAISTALAVTLPIADWMIWGRSSFNPLVILAVLMLVGAAATGVRVLLHRPLSGDAPLALHGKSASASVQNLLFEVGLLATLSWIVDVFLKAFVLS